MFGRAAGWDPIANGDATAINPMQLTSVFIHTLSRPSSIVGAHIGLHCSMSQRIAIGTNSRVCHVRSDHIGSCTYVTSEPRRTRIRFAP